jgi:hypothetical protein
MEKHQLRCFLAISGLSPVSRGGGAHADARKRRPARQGR